ncbi:CAP domain-containing protein [Limibacter armeniacum]|uniref:CAP domain-containing protein n=1 Tax=Limibacter armeniacum TaxID=466084 RepID=UPI002FE5765D
MIRNMSSSLFTLFFLLSSVKALGQWSEKQYQDFKDSDVVSHPFFQEKFNIKQIDYGRLSAAMFFLTNMEREKLGLSKLAYSVELEAAAFLHTKEMGDKNFYAHINPFDSKRREPADRARMAGVQNPHTAENILYEFGYIHVQDTYLSVAKRCVQNWMNSKGHRDNILSKDGQALGCGVYFDGVRLLCAQSFQWYEPIKRGDAVDKLPKDYSKLYSH